ncbi:MAG: hypothetical protein K2Z81_00795 [Cyanobacteria bacterium]|nr:hypothetical protein [Cyanobacteriota bacterium]
MYLTQETVLAMLELFAANNAVTPPWIQITWSEPRQEGGLLNWETCAAEGPLNERFVHWHTQHQEYWTPKAHVPVKLVNVSFDPHAGRNKVLGW